jgi:hypothetical protein
MKKTSKTYVVIWDHVLKNGLRIDEQLTRAKIDYMVWDLNPVPQNRTNWVTAEKVWYYGHFYNSLEDFAKTDHGIFIFNAGDAYSDHHADFVRIVEDQMSADEDIWIMAPRMVNDTSEGVFSLIQMSKSHEQMGLMTHINGIYVAMSREAALDILEYYRWLLKNNYMDFSVMVTGHCLDKVCAAWAIYNNKKVYRKWDFSMRTEISTSYELNTAYSDCKNIKDRFAEYLETLGKDPEPLRKIYEAIEDKDRKFRTEPYPLLKIYVNLENEEDLDY